VRPVATVLERNEIWTRTESPSATADWESPAGGPTALPRIGRLSFTYLGNDDDHLCGQACLALEPPESATDQCAVAFACGCRLPVNGHEDLPSGGHENCPAAAMRFAQ
jgi:hypothetical protein